MGPGSVIVLNDTIKLPRARPTTASSIACRWPKLMETITTDVKLRRLVVNMIYVGVLAELLGIDEAEIERALHAQLGKKPKALALNQSAVKAGMAYRPRASRRSAIPTRLERMNETAGKILIDGNTAARAGRDVRRRHGGDVVSDHAVLESWSSR